jgi:hypothetical protein
MAKSRYIELWRCNQCEGFECTQQMDIEHEPVGKEEKYINTDHCIKAVKPLTNPARWERVTVIIGDSNGRSTE